MGSEVDGYLNETVEDEDEEVTDLLADDDVEDDEVDVDVEWDEGESGLRLGGDEGCASCDDGMTSGAC